MAKAKKSKAVEQEVDPELTDDLDEVIEAEDLETPTAVPVAHVAHKLDPRAILREIKALLAFEPTSGRKAVSESVTADGEILPSVHEGGVLGERKSRMLEALGGENPDAVCGFGVNPVGGIEKVVDVLLEAWPNGIPPGMFK